MAKVWLKPDGLVPLVLPPLAVAATFVFGERDWIPFLHERWPFFVAACFVYLLSHTVRAIRFAIVATRILPLRARMLALLHFNAAPVSIVLPFKLGDLYRLQQLSQLEGNVVRPLLVILLERALDAVVLLVLLGVLLMTAGIPSTIHIVSLVLGGALLAGVLTLTVLGPGLWSLQQYIVTTQSSARVVRLLRLVEFLRRSIELAADCLRGNLALLLCLSALVWILEAFTLVLVAPTSLQNLLALAMSSLSLALGSSTELAQPVSAAVHSYMGVAMVTLFAAWPVATSLYLRRIAQPATYATRPLLIPDAIPAPLAPFDQARILRLHVPRKSL